MDRHTENGWPIHSQTKDLRLARPPGNPVPWTRGERGSGPPVDDPGASIPCPVLTCRRNAKEYGLSGAVLPHIVVVAPAHCQCNLKAYKCLASGRSGNSRRGKRTAGTEDFPMPSPRGHDRQPAFPRLHTPR
jgi:hypothetical protein